jgi:hypothetical protein
MYVFHTGIDMVIMALSYAGGGHYDQPGGDQSANTDQNRLPIYARIFGQSLHTRPAMAVIALAI